jgi:hypothetical protein
MFAACGWCADLSDDEILAWLLALNLERAKAAVADSGNAGGEDTDNVN